MKIKLLFPKNKYGEPVYGIGKRSLLAAYSHLNFGTFPSDNRSFKDTKIKLLLINYYIIKIIINYKKLIQA